MHKQNSFRLKSCISITILLTCIFGYSQKNKQEYDSLYNVYKQMPLDTTKVNVAGRLHELILYSDIEKAKVYLDDQLYISKKLGYKKGLAKSFYNLGGYFENLGNRDSVAYFYNMANVIYKAIKNKPMENNTLKAMAINQYAQGNAEEALSLMRTLETARNMVGDSIEMAKDYNFIAGIFVQLGNQEKAYENVMKALEMYRNLEDELGEADTLYTLSSLEDHRGNNELSITYIKEALDIYRKNDDVFYEALLLSGLSGSYSTLGLYDEALEFGKDALAISKEIKATDIESDANTKIAYALKSKGRIHESITFSLEALRLAEKSNAQLNVLRIKNNLADAYLDDGKYYKAITFARQAEQLAEAINSPVDKVISLDILFNSYKMKGLNDDALVVLEEQHILQDSLYNLEKNKEIEAMRAAFDLERKEQQLIYKDTEINLLEQQEKVSQLQKLSLGVGLFLSLTLMGMAIYGFKQKSKRTKIEKEKLDVELAYKKKELTTHALHLAKKNELLEGLKQKANLLKADENITNGYQQLIRTIDFDLKDDNNWENFANYFQQVHKDFNQSVTQKYPEVTPKELRLILLVKMNLSIKEIANILNISVAGVKKARQRLRKKMNLSTQDSLEITVLNI